jgi:predicted ribosome quality control (RQC) complex YloA/Tae2 family protein
LKDRRALPEKIPQLSSFDVKVLAREIDEALKGYYLDKIYQVSPTLLLFRFNKPGKPVKFLLVEAGRRINLTRYMVEKPLRPPPFCQALRKHLSNARVTSVWQPDLERIVMLDFSSAKGEYKLVAELFAKGNILLLNGKGKILHALSTVKIGGRTLARGETYVQPPSGATVPPGSLEGFMEALKKFKGEVVRALTKIYGVGGIYAEEFLLRAGVEKSKNCREISVEEAERILKAALTVFQGLKDPQPCLYLEADGRPAAVSPFPLERFKNLKLERFETLNEAVDELYSRFEAERVKAEKSEKVRLQLEELKRIASEQEAKLKGLKAEIASLQRIGETIFRNASLLHQLQEILKGMVNRGLNWRQIEAEVSEARKKGTLPLILVSALNPKDKQVKVRLGSLEFELSLAKSVYQEASAYFDKAKRLKSKLLNLEKALKETLEKMASIEALAAEVEAEPIRIGRLREKEWYEKFRYSYTSDGLLMVVGRDASSNEALVKRYAKPSDLIFHSDVAGSPFTLLRVEDKPPSEASIRQAAQFTACYSRAWREGWSAIDVYHVKPEQLSKKAPSGLFLARGSFMVYGKKNYLHGVPLRLALAVKLDGRPKILATPPEAAEAWASFIVEVAPGKVRARDLAVKAKGKLVEIAPKELKPILLRIPKEEFSSLIPYGFGEIVRVSRALQNRK